MKKHVLFIVENAAVPYDVRVWNEALAAKEFGYRVSIISPKLGKFDPDCMELQGIDIYKHRMFEAHGKRGYFLEYGNALFWELLLSLRVFVKKPFHFIHAANPPDTIFLVGLIYKLLGVKFIFDHHDICPETYEVKFGSKGMVYRILLLLEKLTFMTADLVVSTNGSYKSIAMERGKKSTDDVFVVRNGPNLSRVRFAKPNPSWKGGFDHLVVYAGVIGVQERIDVLLKAVDYITKQRKITNIKFIVMGPGTHLSQMIEQSKEMRLEKYVHFTGYVPYSDFYEILASADLCVNPEFRSEFSDKSTMIKIMDYMVFAKPIVQFESTEGRETAGRASEYVKNNSEIDFAEKIVDLLNHPKKRIEMGKIGKERILKRLNWDEQKKILKKAYEHLEMQKNASMPLKELSFNLSFFNSKE